jgi:hypothetical protein
VAGGPAERKRWRYRDSLRPLAGGKYVRDVAFTTGISERDYIDVVI